MPEPSVAACIVNWNTPHDTIECLQSLVDGAIKPDTIVVVDNGSKDDSIGRILTWARQEFAKEAIHVDTGDQAISKQSGAAIEFGMACCAHNSGFAAGANRGVTLAASIGDFDFLWFLNSDTVVDREALVALLDCMSTDPDLGIVGSTVVFTDAPDIVQCAGGCTYNSWTTVIRPFLRGSSLSEAVTVSDEPVIDYVYGASMFVRTVVIEEIGRFNEEYFLYFEELDFCNRLVLSGFKIGWCKESIIHHKESESLRNVSCDVRRQRMFANYHENLSTLIYTKRHHPIGLIFVMLLRVFGKLTVLAIRRDWYLMPVLWRAYSDFLLGVNKRDRA